MRGDGVLSSGHFERSDGRQELIGLGLGGDRNQKNSFCWVLGNAIDVILFARILHQLEEWWVDGGSTRNWNYQSRLHFDK